MRIYFRYNIRLIPIHVHGRYPVRSSMSSLKLIVLTVYTIAYYANRKSVAHKLTMWSKVLFTV